MDPKGFDLIQGINMDAVTEMVGKYKELDAARVELDHRAKSIRAEQDEIKALILQAMNSAGCQSLATPDWKVSRAQYKRFRCPAECRDELREWALESGHEGDLTIMPQRLTAIMHEQKEETGELPVWIDEYVDERLSFRRAT